MLDLEPIKARVAEEPYAEHSCAWLLRYKRDIPTLIAEVEEGREALREYHDDDTAPYFDGSLECVICAVCKGETETETEAKKIAHANDCRWQKARALLEGDE